MANAIRPWLWPGIERELRQTLEWKGGAPGFTPAGSFPKYEDDLSNLRVQSTQLKHNVQILKFLTFEDPLKVVLSDKSISIPATLASAAVLAFKKKYRKRITEGTQGGVIQLLQFEIVVTHLGEPSEQLTLLVQEFKHLGSDGSGTFGDPQPITEKGSLRVLLDELTEFRNREAERRRVNQKGFNTRFPSLEESINESGDKKDDEDDDNERKFATQKPRRKTNHQPPKPLSPMKGLQGRGELKRPRPDKDPGQDSLLQHKSPELGRTASPAAKRQLRDDVTETTRSGINSTTSKTKSVNTNAELLALLANKRGERNTDHTKSTSVKFRNESLLPNSYPVSVVAAPALPEMSEIDNIINGAAIATQSKLRSTSGSPKGSGKNGTTLDGSKRVPSLPESPRVNRISAAQKRCGSSPHIGHNQVADDSTIDPVAKRKLVTVEEVADPWRGMAFVRKKDKFISAPQEKLLNRKDCWLPPERNERAPVSNIPVEILQSLTESAEYTAASADDDIQSPNRRHKTMRKGRSEEFLQKPNSSHVSEEEDAEETPFSSSAWPSSPPIMRKIHELPPDSSMEAPSSVKLDKPREAQESERTGSSEDLASPKCKSKTSSPVQETFSMDHSPRSSTGSLINQDGSDLPVKHPNPLDPASADDEKYELSQALRNPDMVPIEGKDMKLPNSSPASKKSEKKAINLDSDAGESSESDLEMAVPHALQINDRIPYSNMRQQTPSRTVNNRNPILQVHRTPYTVQHQRAKGMSYPRGMDALSQNEKSDKWDVGGGQPNSLNAEVSIQVMVPGTLSQSDHASQINADIDNPTVQRASEAPTTAMNLNRVTHKPLDIIEPKTSTLDVSSAAKTKRRVGEIDDLSSNVTKRRMHIKFAAPDIKDDGDDEKPREDPSTRARQLRREFMKNLRAASNASDAPPSPLLSDVDLRGPCGPNAKPGMHSYVREHDEHVLNQGRSTVWPTGPQTPGEPTSPTKSSPIKRKTVFGPEAHDQVERGLPPVSPAVPAPAEPAQQTILDRFRKAYPEYGGNDKQFTALCRKIYTLQNENRMLHKSLWDDFVIRHQKEYREYLARCADEAEDPMPYEIFYSAEIDEPKFMKRIISPANLAEAISSEASGRKQPPVPVIPVVNNTVDLTQTTPEPQVSEALQRQSSGKSAGNTLARNISSSAARKPSRKLPWSTDNPSSPTPASSRPHNLETSKAPMASSPTSTPKDPFQTPRSIIQPAASNLAVAGPSTAPPRAPPAQTSAAKSTPSHRGKSAVGTIDAKRTVPPATAAPGLSSTKGASSTKHKSAAPPSHNSRKQETTTTHTPLPSATPAKPWYLDPVNPFKTFARANASIRSGADNGFVEEKERQKKGKLVVVNEDGVVMAEMKKVDVLGWHL
ncbi:hypothetical protein MMC30_002424 [Trapelia coarctata]|nr:hypothetical protein [Trapelia coarctata]